jgi:hypothetical protein
MGTLVNVSDGSSMRFLGIYLLVLTGGCLAGAGEGVAAEAGEASGDAAIRRWLADLDSGRFATRQAASRHLRDAGRSAIGPLAEAAASGKAEVARRAIEVLDALTETDDARAAADAEQALQELTNSDRRLAAHRAALSLRTQYLRRQREAVAEVRKLGGSIELATLDDDELIVHQLLLGHNWRGDRADLNYLDRIHRVERLKLYGPRFSDEDIAALAKLSGLQELKLYATEISDEGEQRLRVALPAAMIDRRHGALLGIKADAGVRECRVSMVTHGSAAENAGMQAGDIILQVDDTEIADMPTLIATIAQRKPGDQISIKFRRGGREESRRVVLGTIGEAD